MKKYNSWEKNYLMIYMNNTISGLDPRNPRNDVIFQNINEILDENTKIGLFSDNYHYLFYLKMH